MKDDVKPRVYDVLAKAFAQEEVRVCFALLGDANMNWAARLAEQGCRMIYVRHEHCALASAMAYARKQGDVGVASVTCGPGVTQLITALPAAVRAHLPVVVFAGEAPLKSGWYNQEIDQAPLITATGAAYRTLHLPERMPVAVRDAFLQARRERRPVVIGIPFDLQARPWNGSADLPKPSRELLPRSSPMPPHPDDVAGAAKLVDDASCAGPLLRRSVLHRHLGQLHARGRPRVPEGCRLRRRGRLLARLPRGRRRPALAEGQDAADRYLSRRGESRPGSSAPSLASRRPPWRRSIDGSAARACSWLANRSDGGA